MWRYDSGWSVLLVRVSCSRAAPSMDWKLPHGPCCSLACQGCPMWAEGPSQLWVCRVDAALSWNWEVKEQTAGSVQQWKGLFSFREGGGRIGQPSPTGCGVAGVLSDPDVTVLCEKDGSVQKKNGNMEKICHCQKQDNSLPARCIYFYL